jgi:pyruvate formate lyase activating enzyme
MKATIFNIQKFCIHDGPGIRTTVFFKGCPLKCQWCANPESQQFNEQITYNERNCKRCLCCVHACDKQALSLVDNSIYIDYSKCDQCLKCIDACQYNAMTKEGYQKEIDEIVAEVLKDKDFYEESHGGVTFSGGEVLSHIKEATELAKKLKKENIHIAIETTGFVSSQAFKEFIQYIDLLLFDFKHPDPIKHKEGTGVDNKLILENLKLAKDMNKDILVRMPIIPGYNDSLEDAKKTLKIFNNIGIKNIELLPFHQLGENKYRLLQKEYQYLEKKQLNKEDITYLKEFYEQNNLHVKL